MKHLPVARYDTPHTVTLSVLDWVCIRSNLAVAAVLARDQGYTATAEITQDVLSRIAVQTDEIIEVAAMYEEPEEAA